MLNKLLMLSLLCLIGLYSSSAYASSNQQFSLHIDNDFLYPSGQDRDYTAGLTISLSREKAFKTLPLAIAHTTINKALFPSRKITRHRVELGLYGFTPLNVDTNIPEAGDRPYSSLLYLSSNQEIIQSTETTWYSTLTIGILGLNTFPYLQNKFHMFTGSRPIRGWESQISEGGELTLRYQLSRLQHLNTEKDNVQAHFSQQISIGYITEVSTGISLRIGQLNSEWSHFSPEINTYSEHKPINDNRDGEHFFYTGISTKARLYNVFLQGQFRHSKYTLAHKNLKHILFEAWLGYSQSLGNGYQFNYTIRGHSSEIKQGIGDRHLIWGGITLSKNW